jgi:hypothetical protein
MSRPLEPFPDFPEQPVPATEPAYPAPHKRRHIPLLLIAGLVIILLAAGGAGGYWAMSHRRPAASPSSRQGTADQRPAPQPAANPSAPSGTSQYTSSGHDLNLSFSYPAEWSITPASGNNANDQPITITSPSMSITSSAGKAVTGEVVVSIRPASAPISELAAGSAVIAQDSVQFAYTQPTASQHQYPYLTFVRLGGADANGGFDEVIITGITKFTKSQNLSAESLGGLDPIISARFYTCAASNCTGADAAALSVTAETWQNDAPFTQVQALFNSLQLR